MSTEEDVEINVTMRPRGFEETKKAVNDVGDEGVRASTSYRALSRDFMMTARSINIINREFLGNNVIVKEMVGVLYALTAVLRLATVAEHLLGTASLANTAKHVAEMVAIHAKTAALIIMQAVSGPVGWAILAGAAMVGGAAIASMSKSMKSMQMGGVAAYTGPHFLHEGEVVVNPRMGQGITGHTFINIDMKTGPISNQLDVESMIEDMSSRISTETRKRMGRS